MRIHRKINNKITEGGSNKKQLIKLINNLKYFVLFDSMGGDLSRTSF